MMQCWSRRVPNNLIHSDGYVLVTREAYKALLWEFDSNNKYYEWGHGGPLYFMGRIVVHIDTLGM